jgi:hypothetical protein
MANPQTARRLAVDDHGDLMRAFVLLLALSACGTATPDAALNETDPAITDALSDPIMADPRLELQHGGGSVSVPVGVEGSAQTQTLGQVAILRLRDPAFNGCDPKIDYAFAWMAQLPADLELPDAATVREAAGSNAIACNLRIVRYAIARPVADVEAFYRKQGFAISGSDGIISGVRAKDGTAFTVSILATKSGATVDFVTNRGR